MIVRKIYTLFVSLEYQLIYLIKLNRWLYLEFPLCGGVLSDLCRHFIRIYCSCDISPKAIIGDRVKFPHPLGIVIGEGVIIGDGVKIWHHVTIGSHGKQGASKAYPVIGDNVKIYANSSILGGVKIGSAAIVGAHSLVLKNVSNRKVVAGAPAVEIGDSC